MRDYKWMCCAVCNEMTDCVYYPEDDDWICDECKNAETKININDLSVIQQRDRDLNGFTPECDEVNLDVGIDAFKQNKRNNNVSKSDIDLSRGYDYNHVIKPINGALR